MIKDYIKMKKYEIQLRTIFYKNMIEFVENKADIISTIKKVYLKLKDADPKDIQSTLIHEIAVLAHEQAVKEREIKSTNGNNEDI